MWKRGELNAKQLPSGTVIVNLESSNTKGVVIATAKVVRTQTEDKTIEIQAFQGFPLLRCPLPPAISMQELAAAKISLI